MEIRLAKKEDFDEIFELENEAFSSPYKKEDLEYELYKNPVSKFIIFEKESRIAGFLDFWITFDSATICQICVKNEFKRQGIATKLLQKSIEILKENNVEFYTLEVRKNNIPAIEFYKKNGFIKVTIKKGYYTDGEDAIYMVKGLI